MLRGLEECTLKAETIPVNLSNGMSGISPTFAACSRLPMHSVANS